MRPPNHHKRSSLPFYSITAVRSLSIKIPRAWDFGKGVFILDCIKCKCTLPEGALYCPLCGKKQTPEQRKRRKRANGSGSIYKLQGNRKKPWAAARNGVFLGSFPTYAAAQKALERTTDADITDRYNLTFAQIYELWKPVHAREVSKSQMGNYATAFNQSAVLHTRKFRTLRKSDFEQVILALEEAGKSLSTCEKVKQLFGQLSKWAMDEGIVNQNHSKHVKTTAEQKSVKRAFTEAELRRIQAATSRGKILALVLIGTGARTIELFNVPLSDCFDDYFIAGSKAKKGKPAIRRVIAVADIGKAAYSQILQEARRSGGTRLIDGYAGNRDPANFRKRDFAELMEEIGCTDMTPYNCRHTFSTRAVKAGVTPQMLSRMMGHTDIKTADKHYTHLDKDDILKEISKISATA